MNNTNEMQLLINEENHKASCTSKQLTPEELRWTCPEELFKFKTTEEIEPLDKIVGQPRAIEAIRLGTELNSKGYNIFVSGLVGTGRLTTVKKILETMTISEPELFDYCYVNNFNDPDSPRLIKLPKGKGKKLSNLMNDAITYLRGQLPKMFDEEVYQEGRKSIIEKYQEKERLIIKEFDEKIKPFGFLRGNLETPAGLVQPEIFPIVNNEAVSIDSLTELVTNGTITQEKADEFEKLYQRLHNDLLDIGRKHLKLSQEFRKTLDESNKSSASIVVNSMLDDIKNKFENEKVEVYIEEVKKYILDNILLFVPSVNPVEQEPDTDEETKDGEKFNQFSVNVVLDNSDNSKAPIVIETTPSYTNLFGTIERTFDSKGFWRTDFTKIRGGALLKADNGFLIVNALDLFEEPGVWQALKRVLLYHKLEIQTYEAVFQFSQVYIKPEPVEVNLKVIIIGGLTLYKALYEYEKGFKKIFKINAQFDYETARNNEMIENYSRFISKICKEENLSHCTPSGCAAILEWAVEIAGSQNKITLKFSDVADIIREAAYYDRTSDKDYIDRKDVKKAIELRKYRNDMFDEKFKANIIEGTILIDTSGSRVGQINGLTVLDDGIVSFGMPARITANVSSGSSGIVNIEREVELSGPIHNKGVLIISGFITERFAQKKPLNLSATIAFEQNYGGIEGDSASAAEIYVLLSAICEIPINQSFAITGSVNQKGDIQPIGGVNEKIRGYYEICKSRGLTGEHAVIIPEQNIKDLMLCDELIDDVKTGKFKIFSISRIEDGFPLLMGMAAGERNIKGNYPKNTVFRYVEDRLAKLADASKEDKVSKKKKNFKH